MLSVVLTASVLYPAISETVILAILIGGSAIALAVTGSVTLVKHRRGRTTRAPIPDRSPRETWRMPPLGELPRAPLTPLNRIWLGVLRGYLVIAGGAVLAPPAQVRDRGWAGGEMGRVARED